MCIHVCPAAMPYFRRLQARKRSSHWFCNLFHFWENFSVFMRNLSQFLQTQLLTTIYLSARGITATSWMKNLDLIRFLGIPHTILHYFCIRSAGQPKICPHFLWNRFKWRRNRFAIYLLHSKMHKNPYKHPFIAGSAKSSTKPPSILLIKLLTYI